MDKPIIVSVIGAEESARQGLIDALSGLLREKGYRVGCEVGSEQGKTDVADLIFLNNDLSDQHFKIEIAFEEPRAKNDMSVFALIGSRKFRVGRPEFQKHEIEAVTEFLVEQFLKTHLLE